MKFLEAGTRVDDCPERAQTTASEFLKKDIDKFIDFQTNESTKKIHIWRNKAKHGTERNKLKCQLLKA